MPLDKSFPNTSPHRLTLDSPFLSKENNLYTLITLSLFYQSHKYRHHENSIRAKRAGRSNAGE